MKQQTSHFEARVSPQWGGRAKVKVEPTSEGDYVVEIRPKRSRSVVRAELGLLVEIALERDAKAQQQDDARKRRSVRRSLV